MMMMSTMMEKMIMCFYLKLVVCLWWVVGGIVDADTKLDLVIQ
jgi:hypothetical protein